MPDNPCEYNQNPRKVIHEIVAFRYTDEESIMLVGEAEVMMEVLAGFGDETEISTNLYSVRVDILSAFDADDRDVYAEAISNPAIKQKLEEAAISHYFHPPKVPIGLPKKITEW